MSESQTLPVSIEEFKALISPFIEGDDSFAVALSGGPDSMALAWLMGQLGRDVHLLHVDHGLREESGAQSERLKALVSDWPHVTFVPLKWAHEAVLDRIQERARNARYDLMAGYCQAHDIQKLFLAHHQDDQAETVLFRLAKGSGLDGLSAMQPEQEMGGVMLCRPFLDIPKARLLETCRVHHLEYLQDPSNENADFSRVRLRAARDVLEAEGLSNKRLSLTSKRLLRARKTLDSIAIEAYQSCAEIKNTDRIEFNFNMFCALFEEVALRVLLRGVKHLRPDADYAPRLEKIETLFEDFYFGYDVRKRTLGGIMFEVDERRDAFVLSKEKA